MKLPKIKCPQCGFKKGEAKVVDITDRRLVLEIMCQAVKCGKLSASVYRYGFTNLIEDKVNGATRA